MAYTWNKANAKAARPAHHEQYLRRCSAIAPSITTAGWATTPVTIRGVEREAVAPCDHPVQVELYNVMEDPPRTSTWRPRCGEAQAECKNLFYSRLRSTTCSPLDNTTLARWKCAEAELDGGRTTFTYSGALARAGQQRPHILNKSYTITAEVHDPLSAAEGMIVTQGGRSRRLWPFPEQGRVGFGRGKGGVPL